MITIKAFQLADSIDIKQLKKDYVGELYAYSISELFYYSGNEKYLYILSYGAVIFAGYSDIQISEILDFLGSYLKNPLSVRLIEDFTINEKANEDKFGHNEAHLSRFSPEILKIVMLNVGQSVVLEYYQNLSDHILEETNKYTTILERDGKLSIRSKELLKVIGRTLNVKNNIVDQLFVLDQPEETWNDEYLSKIDTGIRQIFDIKLRFQNIDYSLRIVKENLELFKDLLLHERSSLFEIIIIILIMVEVANLFVEKIF